MRESELSENEKSYWRITRAMIRRELKAKEQALIDNTVERILQLNMPADSDPCACGHPRRLHLTAGGCRACSSCDMAAELIPPFAG